MLLLVNEKNKMRLIVKSGKGKNRNRPNAVFLLTLETISFIMVAP